MRGSPSGRGIRPDDRARLARPRGDSLRVVRAPEVPGWRRARRSGEPSDKKRHPVRKECRGGSRPRLVRCRQARMASRCPGIGSFWHESRFVVQPRGESPRPTAEFAFPCPARAQGLAEACPHVCLRWETRSSRCEGRSVFEVGLPFSWRHWRRCSSRVACPRRPIQTGRRSLRRTPLRGLRTSPQLSRTLPWTPRRRMNLRPPQTPGRPRSPQWPRTRVSTRLRSPRTRPRRTRPRPYGRPAGP